MRDEKGRYFADDRHAHVAGVGSEVVLRIVELDAVVALREEAEKSPLRIAAGSTLALTSPPEWRRLPR